MIRKPSATLPGLLAGLVLLLASGAAPSLALASHSQQLIFDAPNELVQDQGGLRDGTLDELRAFGVDTVRVLVYWRSMAPSPGSATKPGGSFNASDPATYPAKKWDPYDQLIAAAHLRGMKVLLTPTGPVPDWASRDGDGARNPKPADFYDFVHALGIRYNGTYRPSSLPVPLPIPTGSPLPRADMWSIWNEPNIRGFLGPQIVNGKPHAAKLYRQLYIEGHQALVDTGNGPSPILIGETAPAGRPEQGDGSGALTPLAFLRAVLCLDRSYRPKGNCSRLQAAGWATHPYSFQRDPFAAPRDRDWVTIGVLDRLTRALDAAGHAGALPAQLPIYVTEFGVQSYPDHLAGVSLPRQAELRSIAERVAFANPRVAAFSQYLMRDDAPDGNGSHGGFESGLRFHNGNKKPSYNGFRTPLAVRRIGGRVSIWGMIRPATSATHAQIQFRDGSGKARLLKRVTTTGAGYFTTGGAFGRGRSWRVVWTDPQGTRFLAPWTPAY